MLFISIGALVVIYLISFYIGKKLEYKKAYWFFELFHLLAGFFLAMLFSNFFTGAALIIGAVLAVGLLWEIWEWIADSIPTLRKMIKQGPITLSDSLFDLLLEFVGAIIFIVLF